MRRSRRIIRLSRACLIGAAIAWACDAAHAQFVTTPNNMDVLAGNGGLRTPVSPIQSTWQGIIAQSELNDYIAGDRIIGLQWRALSRPANVPFFPPTTAITWPNFDIYISSAATSPATMSNTFALNDGPDITSVRSGPLTLQPQAYFNTQQPGEISPWGPLIEFDTPFIYQGGNITITVRHNGHNNFDAPNFSFDSVFPFGEPARPEYGTLVAGLATFGYTAQTGGGPGFVITRLQFEPVPEPATFVLLTFAASTLRNRHAKS